jgi:hypothetical protein
MSLPVHCQRMRMGGVVSGSAISGGTLLETYGRNLMVYDGIMGHAGKRGSNAPLLGQDGSRHMRDKPYRERLMTLQLVAYSRGDDGTITLPGGGQEHLEDNIDLMLDLLTADDEQVILEQDWTGGTRWIAAEAMDAATFSRGPIFGDALASYVISQVVVAAYPFWQSEALITTVVNGAGSVPNAGNARISNPVLVFNGNGTFENIDTGEEITVSGAGGALTVDVGAGQITQGGVPAARRVTVNTRHWMRFGRGSTAVTSTVSVQVRTRDSWQT